MITAALGSTTSHLELVKLKIFYLVMVLRFEGTSVELVEFLMDCEGVVWKQYAVRELVKQRNPRYGVHLALTLHQFALALEAVYTSQQESEWACQTTETILQSAIEEADWPSAAFAAWMRIEMETATGMELCVHLCEEHESLKIHMTNESGAATKSQFTFLPNTFPSAKNREEFLKIFPAFPDVDIAPVSLCLLGYPIFFIERINETCLKPARF
jgi:hypothetical protein